MRSLLSCLLFVDGALGALNLYAGRSQDQGVVDRSKALIFATRGHRALCGEALDDATVSSQRDPPGQEPTPGARLREVIGRAEGIVIERERISPDQAFGLSAAPRNT